MSTVARSTGDGAQEGTRDAEIAGWIGAVEENVGFLSREVKNIAADADAQDAHGCVGLYRAVHGQLEQALAALDEAWDVMLNGNPEHYA